MHTHVTVCTLTCLRKWDMATHCDLMHTHTNHNSLRRYLYTHWYTTHHSLTCTHMHTHSLTHAHASPMHMCTHSLHLHTHYTHIHMLYHRHLDVYCTITLQKVTKVTLISSCPHRGIWYIHTHTPHTYLKATIFCRYWCLVFLRIGPKNAKFCTR